MTIFVHTDQDYNIDHNIDETSILPQTLTSSIFIYTVHIFVRVVPPAAEYEDLYSRLCSDRS